MSNTFFPPKNLAIYEMIMKNTAEPDKPHVVEKETKGGGGGSIFMLGL